MQLNLFTREKISPRSLTTTTEAKNNLLIWWFEYYRLNGVPFNSIADMVKHKYKCTLAEFYKIKWTEDWRKEYYRLSGRYGNNRAV